MEVWQIILLSYLALLVIWLAINIIFLLASFIVRRKVFMGLEAIGAVLAVLFSIATGIGDLALIVWLFQIGQFFWAILAIILGISLVSFAGSILAAPFAIITVGFSTWYDSIAERGE